MRTVSHRGASALAPENTLLSVQLAISHRVDVTEVDVHLSRDGQLVVHHDPEVMIGDARVPIASLSASELADVPKGNGETVPTLEQVLELAAGRIGVYVELKSPGSGEALGPVVRRSPPSELIVGSFSPSAVAEARLAAPSVPRSVLFREVTLATMIETCRTVDARFAHPCHRPITPGAIARLHAAGLKVMTPHTNDPGEAERFRAAGADYVASDDPLLLAGLASRPAAPGSYPSG
jgi:glycerophosphoryl diester phosphodiesterase